MWNLADTGGVKTSNPSTMTTQQAEPSDTDLVARARAGDSAAFGALVGRYQHAALRLAAAITGSVDDAADIRLHPRFHAIHKAIWAQLKSEVVKTYESGSV